MRHIALTVFLLFVTGCIFAQSLPVKSGLWENDVLDDNGKVSFRTLSCVTPSSFTDMLGNVNKHPGCKITSQNLTSKTLTVDMSCDRPRVQMSSHGVLDIVDSEHIRGTSTVKMTLNGQTSVTTAKSSGQFKSSSCGDIKPGQPKILQ